MEWNKLEAAPAVRRTAELIDTTIDFVEQDLSGELRRCVPDALLEIAVSRLYAQRGKDAALRILTALAADVADSTDGYAERTIRPIRIRVLSGGVGPVATATDNVVPLR